MTTTAQEVREALAQFEEGMQEAANREEEITRTAASDHFWEAGVISIDVSALARQLNRIESQLRAMHVELSGLCAAEDGPPRIVYSGGDRWPDAKEFLSGLTPPAADAGSVTQFPRKLERVHPIDRWRKMMEDPPTGIGGEVAHLSMENLYRASQHTPAVLKEEWPEMWHLLQTTELTRREIFQLTGVSGGSLGAHEDVLKPCYGTGKGARKRLYKGVDVHRWMRSRKFKGVVRRKKERKG